MVKIRSEIDLDGEVIGSPDISNFKEAYSWGDHAEEGYLKTETDPTVPAHVKAITSPEIADWNTAFGWGDHADEGYIKSETDPTVSAAVKAISSPQISSWDAAFSWGNHAAQGYAKIITQRSTWQSGESGVIRTVNLNSAARKFELELVLTGSISGANTIAILINNVATNSYQSTQVFPGGAQTPSGVIGYLRLPTKNANSGGQPTLYRLYLECHNYQGILLPRFLKGWFVEIRTDLNVVQQQGELYGVFYTTSISTLTSLRFSAVDSGTVFGAGSYIELSEYY